MEENDEAEDRITIADSCLFRRRQPADRLRPTVRLFRQASSRLPMVKSYIITSLSGFAWRKPETEAMGRVAPLEMQGLTIPTGSSSEPLGARRSDTTAEKWIHGILRMGWGIIISTIQKPKRGIITMKTRTFC